MHKSADEKKTPDRVVRGKNAGEKKPQTVWSGVQEC